MLLPQLLLSAVFLTGLLNGIVQSFGIIPSFGLTEWKLSYYAETFQNREVLRSLSFSLYVSFVSAALATVAGVLLCWVLVRRRAQFGIMMRIIELPVIIPHVVVALFIVNLCSQNGLIARLFFQLGLLSDSQSFPLLIYDPQGRGIILAYLWKEIPFIVYFTAAMLGSIDQRLGEAAVNLGAGSFAAFRKVTLPLCMPNILTGFLIIFLFSMGAYELPMLLGSTAPKALPVLAYLKYTHPDLQMRPYAMAINGLIILVCLLSSLLYFWLMRRAAARLSDHTAGNFSDRAHDRRNTAM